MLALLVASLLAQTDAGTPDDGQVDAARQTVITGSRTERLLQDVVVPTEVITRTQIEAHGARDLGQLLQQHPGVDLVYSFRGTGIRLQGLDPEYILILIDGERVSGRVGNTIDLSRYSLRDVERIELIKGPGAALYGADAIGGVINLITRRVQNPAEASVRASFGTRQEFDVRGHAGIRQGPVEARLGGGYRSALPYDLDPKDAATSGAGFKRFDGDATVILTPTDRVSLTGKIAYLRRDEDAVDISPSRAVFDRHGRQEQFDFSLSSRFRPDDASTVTARLRQSLFIDQLLQDQRGARDLDTYTRSANRIWEAGTQVDHQVGSHTITGALELYSELLASTRLDSGQAQRQRFAGLIQDEWKISQLPSVTLAPGIRYDLDTIFGGAPSPRVAVKVDPSPNWTIRGSWGMGFRAPSFTELYLLFTNTAVGYVVEGNPSLKPETSMSVNLAADYRLPWDGWMLSASGFHTSITNLISVNTNDTPNPDNPSLFRYDNVSQAYTQGVDLSARMKVSRGAWIDLGYSLLDARDVTRARQLEGRAAHRLTSQIGAKYRSLGLEVVIRTSVVSARPYYLDNNGDGVEETVWAAPYVDLEAQLTWTFRDWLRVFVNAYNLAGAGDPTFYPRPPRGVLGGLQLAY